MTRSFAMRSNEQHECPGLACGRDDIPGHRVACSDCLDRLPQLLREPLDRMMRDGASPEDFLPVVARCKIWWENRQTGL